MSSSPAATPRVSSDMGRCAWDGRGLGLGLGIGLGLGVMASGSVRGRGRAGVAT